MGLRQSTSAGFPRFNIMCQHAHQTVAAGKRSRFAFCPVANVRQQVMKIVLVGLVVGGPILGIDATSGRRELIAAEPFWQEVADHVDAPLTKGPLSVGLPGINVTGLHIDAAGNLWARTPQGGARWSADSQSWHSAVVTLPTSGTDIPEHLDVRQFASHDGREAVATATGIWERVDQADWQRLTVADRLGRHWAAADVRGVTYDASGRLWFATLAGVGYRDDDWHFFSGRDGLPFNDFTCCAAAPNGDVWFGTTLGAIRYRDGQFAYRQGKRWLPHDHVQSLIVDPSGIVWIGTPGGIGRIRAVRLTLQQKADIYDAEIDQYLKRTEFGYVAEAGLEAPGDRGTSRQHDSDNDGLWTAMYGAAQCFAVATRNAPDARGRAKKAFEALRFLQVVTQGGSHSPPPGYVARTILPTAGPNPNRGADYDRQKRDQQDRKWKIMDPRWPISNDGQWYWKSDTSSDELDGHYFFYPLYYDLVAETEEEKQRVRDVVRALTDHLIDHDFALQDHDGAPTRWAVFGPAALNHDHSWHVERGLNSLSMLSYLAVARHVTGDDRYEQVAKKLIDEHGYAANLMVPKMQRGIGSGNQSDDEMAVMSFYNLVKYTRDPQMRTRYLESFFAYWMLEQPERNPFFHFAYAALGRGAMTRNAYGSIDMSPWGDWLADSVGALRRFPLDRVSWSHQNSHRLDILRLPPQQGSDMLERMVGDRGYRVDGKVLPVDERFFAHWNTDPWRLDTGSGGRQLASGTVYLLPYYMGRYHGLLDD